MGLLSGEDPSLCQMLMGIMSEEGTWPYGTTGMEPRCLLPIQCPVPKGGHQLFLCTSPSGHRLTCLQGLEPALLGIRLKASKWVSRLPEKPFRGPFRRQDCNPFPFTQLHPSLAKGELKAAPVGS